MITFRGPRPRNRVPFDGAAVGLERPGQVPAGVGRSRPDPRYGTGGDRRPDGERDTRNRRDVRPNLTVAVDGADKAAWTAGSGTAPYFWNAAASWWRRPCRRTWDCPGGERGTGNHGTAHPGGRPPGTCLWSRGPAHVDGGGTGTVQGAVHTSRGPPVPSERDGVEIDIRCLRGAESRRFSMLRMMPRCPVTGAPTRRFRTNPTLSSGTAPRSPPSTGISATGSTPPSPRRGRDLSETGAGVRVAHG